jgi:hypothetical protein
MVLNQSPFLAVLQFPLVYFRSYVKLIVDWGPGKVPVQLFFFPMSFSTIHHSRDADTTGFYFPLYVLPVSISLINCRICFQRIVNTSSVNLNYFHKKTDSILYCLQVKIQVTVQMCILPHLQTINHQIHFQQMSNRASLGHLRLLQLLLEGLPLNHPRLPWSFHSSI